jgi:TBC1 domain family member 20
VEVLRRYPALCYFQGYHDIIQVLYLVLGAQDAPSPAIRLSLLRIRDYMLPTLEPAIRHLELLPAILRIQDPALYNHVPLQRHTYALGATLTLFSHVIDAYEDITRLFDFFLASDAAIPVYFFASIILSRRDELLELDREEDEAIFFVVLGKLPQPFDLEDRIADTVRLYARLHPQSLGRAWRAVSTSSVLKASASPFDVARLSLDDGQALFGRQEQEVQRQQAWDKAALTLRRIQLHVWRYRRPGAFGLAIAVGMYAVWLGRNGDSSSHRIFDPLSNILKKLMGSLA